LQVWGLLLVVARVNPRQWFDLWFLAWGIAIAIHKT